MWIIAVAYFAVVLAGTVGDWIKWHRWLSKYCRPTLLQCVLVVIGKLAWNVPWIFHWYLKPRMKHWGDQFKDL